MQLTPGSTVWPTCFRLARTLWPGAALVALVAAAYFARLTALPVCGEESRWAGVAREMIATGDWIAPRQQGALFPERPPLGSWAMALAGLARGEVDLWAIRLPTALATLALTLAVYAYARLWLSQVASFAAAAAYATFGQVLQIGRLGESEALFALFTGGALLAWHACYMRGRAPLTGWSCGYALAALGALVKGPQAPVYFVASCSAYLLLVRDWRWLFGRGHAVGLAAFAAIVGAWFVPFAVLHAAAVDDIWAGLAQDRFQLDGLAKHVVEYPFETLGCLLPWSPLLAVLAYPRVFRSLLGTKPEVKFLLVALAVTYPTVWVAAGARGRYYMPMYPLVAVLVGLAIEQCIAPAAARAERLFWRRFQRVLALVVATGGGVVVAASLFDIASLADAAQPAWFLAVWIPAALAAGGLLAWASLNESGYRPQVAVGALAAFLALASSGVMVSARLRGANPLEPAVASLRERLAEGQLVSLGRVYHRFAYAYDEPIRRVAWPTSVAELPPDVEYFCFDCRPGDTPELRAASDGYGNETTPGTLPFAWEEVARIECDPVARKVHNRTVVIGRVRRDFIARTPAQGRVR